MRRISAPQRDSRELLTRARYERKILLEEEAALALEIAVADRLPLKLFPGGDLTRITTLYFDRADGLISRHARLGRGAHLRVRAKLFTPARKAARPATTLALEVKRRRGGLTRKERVWCPPEQLLRVLASKVHDRRLRSLRLDRLVPAPHPVAAVGYERRVYEAPGELRITIDRRLGCRAPGPEVIAALAAGMAPEIPPAPDGRVVVEVKHLGPLPPWIAGAAAHCERGYSKLVWALEALER